VRTISLHDFTTAKVLSVPDSLSLSGEHRTPRGFFLVESYLLVGGSSRQVRSKGLVVDYLRSSRQVRMGLLKKGY
jgi:hypothetical protein